MRMITRHAPFALLCFSILCTPAAFADPGTNFPPGEMGPGNYQRVQQFMKDLVRQNPDTTRLFDLGPSDSGETIQGLAIASKGATGTVHNLVVATHHGNEYGATDVAKAFAASVAADPIPGQTVYVIPVLNIWGYDNDTREELLNGQYLDPNRNYPGPCGTEGPFTLKDTAALARFIDKEGIVASATLHTFSPAVVYPWGLASNDLATGHEDIFTMLVRTATERSHYQVGNSTEVIYPANGTYEDYAYWKHGIWSILFELGDSHTPDIVAEQEMVSTNIPGLRDMFLAAPRERATMHDFTGVCSPRSFYKRDRHDE